MALATLTRLLRLRHYYSVPQAGAQIGLGRTRSYEEAQPGGAIPVERHGKLMLVPRDKWDRRVRRVLLDKVSRKRVSRSPGTINVAVRKSGKAASTGTDPRKRAGTSSRQPAISCSVPNSTEKDHTV